MTRPCPRLVIGALRGSAGKTTLCASLAAALGRRGFAVAPFKKGPDYIDAAWLSLASGRTCRNLDTFLMGREEVVRSFSRHASGDAVSLIEGNRGLYDGTNLEGEHSTAELAKLLKAPVVLVVDCDKVTRTMAAMILGCQHFDRSVAIRGVILNRVAGNRHAAIVRKTVEDRCRLPVFGTVPRMADIPFSERHLGLIPPQEQERNQLTLERAARIAGEYLDLDGLVDVARGAPDWEDIPDNPESRQSDESAGDPVTIGVIRDRAFQFYYPENLEALAARGARIIEISALRDSVLPPVDALYIGGGFPETQARLLAENEAFRRSLREAAEEGLPIYAECGGFMFLGETLIVGGHHYPMVGFLPVSFEMEKRPQGHGYTVVDVERENPFFPVGTRLTGHEFHYSRLLSWEGERQLAFRLERGSGIDGRRDGLCRKNVLASFTHLHALGTPRWAEGLVERARWYRAGRRGEATRLPIRAGRHEERA
jgi:cobyrinic acid a,c-diamide synthase